MAEDTNQISVSETTASTPSETTSVEPVVREPAEFPSVTKPVDTAIAKPVDNTFQFKLNKLKEAGVPDQELNAYTVRTGAKLLAAGVPQDKVDEYIGNKLPDMAGIQTMIKDNIEKQVNSGTEEKKPLSIEEALNHGFQTSVSGLMARQKLPEQELTGNEPWYTRAAATTAQVVGDIPAMVAGAAVGAAGGAETGPGAAITGMGGAFALPSALRQVYIDSISKGEFNNFSEFMERAVPVAIETAKSYVTGVGTGAVGIAAAPLGAAVKLGTEGATMTSISAALNGKAPTAQDFIDNGIVMFGMHGATKGASYLRGVYKDTGVSPVKVMEDAKKNPEIAKAVEEGRTPEAYEHLMEKKIVEKVSEDTMNRAKDYITEDIYKKATEAGVEHEEATYQAIIMAARYATRAQRLGVAPLTLYKEKELGIERGDEEEVGINKLNTLYQSDSEKPVFKSALVENLEGVQQEKGSTQQWEGIVKNLTQKGVKQEELDYYDLPEWIKEQGDISVTKQEIINYIKANELHVDEVEKGELSYISDLRKQYQDSVTKVNDSWQDVTAKAEERTELMDKRDELRKQLLKAETENKPAVKYSKYQTPGGENYKELLITLPIEEIQKRREKNGIPANGFKSSHFDEPNVVAHVRFNERSDKDGNKVLFIEELQSDWHQKGRKEGYAIRNPTFKDAQQFFGIRNEIWSQMADADKQAYVEEMTSGESHVRAGVPDAPFKKSWTELSLKRMLRYAVDNGMDKIAWTTGEMQNARYDLSKQVKEVTAKKWEDGRIGITFIDNNGERHTAGEFKENDLEEVVGKELSQKIVSEHKSIEEGDITTYKGLDLKVGGKGMKGFYDEILPAAVNKLIKKYGVRVENSEIPVETEQPVTQNTSEQEKRDIYYKNLLKDSMDEELAKEIAYNSPKQDVIEGLELYANIFKESNTEKVYSIELTPALKEAVSNPQTLFQKGRAKVTMDDNKRLITLFKTADKSSLIHESGHIWLEEMKEDANRKDAPRQLKDDWEIIKKYIGHEGNGSISTEAHETFAKQVEAYFREGKAPSAALKKVFDSFKQWLTDIYKTIKDLGVEINPGIHDIFDRLLATDKEIAVNKPKSEFGDNYLPPAKAFQSMEGASVSMNPLNQILNPVNISESSRDMATALRQAKGPAAQSTAMIQDSMQKYAKDINKLNNKERLDLIDYMENRTSGAKIPNTELQTIADTIKNIYSQMADKVKQVFPDAGLRQDYFTHQYENEAKAKQFFSDWVAKQGSERNLQERVFPSLKEAMDAGLQPRTTNPVETVMHYVINMNNLIAAHKGLELAQEAGIADYFKRGQQPDGWVPLNGNLSEKGGKTLYAPEDAARIYNNDISEGITGPLGSIIDVVNKSLNAADKIILGLSGYHFSVVTQDAIASEVANAAFNNDGLGEKIVGTGLAVKAPVNYVKAGSQLIDAYLGRSNLSPEFQQALDLAVRNNTVSVRQPEYWRAGPAKSYVDAFKAGTVISDFKEAGKQIVEKPLTGTPKVIATEIGKFVDSISHPLFEVYIPRLKISANISELHDWLQKHPEATSKEKDRAAQDIGNSIDNRFGEMMRDNLFWDKSHRQVLQVAFLSYSWVVGGMRMLKGILDAAATILTGKELTSNAKFLFGMAFTHVTMSAVANYLATGQAPQSWRDIVYPRTGGTTPEGKEERMMWPGHIAGNYTSYLHNGIRHGLQHEINPPLKLLGELLDNEDFRDKPITNNNNKWYDQQGWKDYTAHVLEQSQPIGLKSLLAGKKKGSKVGIIKRLLGIRTAPEYITNPEGFEEKMTGIHNREFQKKLKSDKKLAAQYEQE